MNSTALKLETVAASLTKADPNTPAFRVEGRTGLFIKAGATLVHVDGELIPFAEETEISILAEDLQPGRDFGIWIGQHGAIMALPDGKQPDTGTQIGGFHFAPGGNAAARAGGDSEPAINAFSCWDLAFRPACPDPRGMFVIDMPDGKAWVDIYKLGVDHLANGTSRFGVTIADGRDLPQRIDGNGRYDHLDYKTAVEIMAHHGKQLLTYDEFRVAAFGVTEKSAQPRDPKITGLDAPRTSQRGMMQASGNLWDWGTDGDPDEPRASFFGGSWIDGGSAGSRCADLDYWPGYSYVDLSARGRSDHLMPA